MLSQLLRPFSYLTIKHVSRLPTRVNWVAPLSIAGIFALFFCLPGLRVDVFSGNGLFARIFGFVQSLPGFYIAALAAIATFNNPDMLKPMPGVPPTVEVEYAGGMEVVALTRRRFLSSMFAYLTAISIVLAIVAALCLALAQPIKDLIPVALHLVARGLVIFLLMTMFFQIIIITLWGIYYLGERIHTPDS